MRVFERSIFVLARAAQVTTDISCLCEAGCGGLSLRPAIPKYMDLAGISYACRSPSALSRKLRGGKFLSWSRSSLPMTRASRDGSADREWLTQLLCSRGKLRITSACLVEDG